MATSTKVASTGTRSSHSTLTSPTDDVIVDVWTSTVITLSTPLLIKDLMSSTRDLHHGNTYSSRLFKSLPSWFSQVKVSTFLVPMSLMLSLVRTNLTLTSFISSCMSVTYHHLVSMCLVLLELDLFSVIKIAPTLSIHTSTGVLIGTPMNNSICATNGTSRTASAQA